MTDFSSAAARSRLFAAALLAGASLSALALPAIAHADQLAQSAGQHDFLIPPQSLADALTSFSQQSGLQVSVDSALVAGLNSNGAGGTMSADAALALLLAGTNLIGTYASETTIIIEPLPASSENGATQLGPITVLGSRHPDVPLSNVPSAITQVEREEIHQEASTANRLDEILAKKVPGLNPTNNGVRQIRGRTAQVFINGVPVNEQLRAGNGSDLNLVSLDQVAGVEVSRGANSAYGFGSPGGIIALSTPRADSEELELRTILRESFNPSHLEGSSQASLYQSASQIVGDFDFHIAGSVAYDGADYDPDGNLALGFDNSALLTNGKEFLYNFDTSMGLDLGDSGALRLTGTFGYVDFDEHYKLNEGIYREEYGFLSVDPAADQDFRRSHTVNLTYENADILGNALKLEIFTSNTKTHRFETVGDVFRIEEANEYYGARSAITTPLDFITGGAAITFGADALRNRHFGPYYNDDTGELITYFSPDVTLDVVAPYAQIEVPFGDFILSGGVRHERYSGHVKDGDLPGSIEGGDINDFDITLFNAGLVYFVNDNVDVYATFSQGAEISQLGRAAREAPSADLVDPQPAKSNQYELGVRGEWSDLSFGLAGFYTQSDLLSAVICDSINPCVPLREPREFWGIEANADWRIDEQWGVGGVFTWQEGIRELEDGEKRDIGSRDIPPVFFTANLDYDPFPWWRNRLQLSYRADRDPFGDSVEYGEGRVEDLVLLDASAAFDVGPGELQLGVRNLLNTKYTGIPSEADNFGFLWVPEQGTRPTLTYAITW
jgi:iron complex outermembrane recepter protein